MAKYTAALLLSALLLAGCDKSGAVVKTPFHSYTKEDIINKAEDYCKQYGMLPSEVRADEGVWQRLVDDVIREYVYADLSVLYAEEIGSTGEPEASEDEIRSKYETLLFSQKQYFSEKKEIVSAAIKYPRDTIVYYPSGLKWVKFFVVPFEPEIRGEAAIFLSEGKIDEYEKWTEAAETDKRTLIREIRQKLQNGNFDSLAAEYGGATEDLLYAEDNGLFPAQLRALQNLKKPGDITEYNIYQGHVFMLFEREPDYIEVPYEIVRDELAATIIKNKTIIEHDRLMKKLYEEAIAKGLVKVKIKGIKELSG